MQVYILHKDVPYESGEVIGVFFNGKSAETRKQKIIDEENDDPDIYTVESWEVED